MTAGLPTWLRELMLLALLATAVWGSAALMARIAGWHRLAARYPAPARVEGRGHRFVSAAIGSPTFPVHYRGCVRLVVGEAGLFVSLMALLRFGTPAFFVPWHEVESVEERQRLGLARATFHFRGERACLTLRGPLAQQVHAACRAAQGAAPG